MENFHTLVCLNVLLEKLVAKNGITDQFLCFLFLQLVLNDVEFVVYSDFTRAIQPRGWVIEVRLILRRGEIF